jgi:glycosyltransferase involved in cell wall biosynthesis
MRVAVASWTARYAGGIESYLAAVMPAMRQSGLDVSFFHEVDEPAQRGRIDEAAGVAAFSVASSGVESALAQLSKWKPDVVYAHGLHDATTADRLLAFAPSVTFVHTYTGTCISGTKTHISPQPVPCSRRFGPACFALYFPRRCGGKNPVTMVKLYRSQLRHQQMLAGQAAVITHSEHMKNELVRHGIVASVVAYPSSVSRVDESSAAHVSNDILFAGRMDRLKGGMMLLDALPQIRRELGRPLHVQFSGDGPDRQQWMECASSIHARDAQISIRFPGWADEAELSAQMRASRLLVVPSVWPEPFGSVGPAAGRCGLPAAAFAVGGIPQWLHDGVNGHLAFDSPPTPGGLAGAVVRCLRDPQHYAELSRGARQMAARFTMERHLLDLMSVFEKTLHGRRR